MTADFRRFDPYAPRPQQPVQRVHPASMLATQQGAAMLASVLIHKLGGRVLITQADLDTVAWTRLMESNDKSDTGTELNGQALCLWLEQPMAGGMMQ